MGQDNNKIKQEAFRSYNLEEEGKSKDTFTIRLNPEERKQLNEDKELLQQSKDSTALKQLARIGSIVLHSQKIAAILEVVTGNKRRNKRLGVVDFD